MTNRTLQNLYLRAARNRWLQKAYYDLWTVWDWMQGPIPELKPPRKVIAEIGGRWELGPQMVKFIKSFADLKPNESVLEIGVGIGRIAIPMIQYLEPPGRFESFDIVKKYIRWCQLEVTSKYPHGNFTHVDLYNKQYNRIGRFRGETFDFPYESSSFDFVYLTSVFTHLLPGEAKNYISEISRVLKPGGRCFATFFLLNEESERCLAEGKGAFALEPLGDSGAQVRNKDVPEEFIALPESLVIDEFSKVGMVIKQGSEWIRWGSWCGRKQSYEFQDMLLLYKR